MCFAKSERHEVERSFKAYEKRDRMPREGCSIPFPFAFRTVQSGTAVIRGAASKKERVLQMVLLVFCFSGWVAMACTRASGASSAAAASALFTASYQVNHHSRKEKKDQQG